MSRRYLRILSGLLVLLFIWGSSITAFSQSFTITMPDTLLKSGDTELLPISVSTINPEDSVLSGEFTLNYDDNVIEAPQVETSSTLLENTSVTYNATTRKIAFANDSPISGEGVLFYLQVKMKSDLSQGTGTNLDMSRAEVNENDGDISVSTGRVATPNISISPSDPLVTVNDTIQFSTAGDIFGSLTWTISNTSIAAIDDNGVLIPDTTGNLQVTVTDSIGTEASTDLFRINPENLAELNLSTPDTTTQQTRTLVWPVNVSDLTGLDITSAQFELVYPDQHLEYRGIITENALIDAWSGLEINAKNDIIKLAAAGADPLSGQGPLIYFQFEVRGDASGSHAPDLRNALFNEDLDPTVNEGTITINEAPDILVRPDTMKMVIGDRDTAHVESGGISPYTWESSDTSIADVERQTGVVTGNGSGTNTLFAFDSVGVKSDPVAVHVHDVRTSIPDTTTQYPDSLMLPVKTDDLTSLDVFAYELALKYDTTVLDFDEIHTRNSLSENMTVSVNEDSLIKIAAAGTNALAGAGTLIWLDFSFVEETWNGDVSDINFEKAILNEPNGDNPTALPSDGRVEIDGFPKVPDLQNPDDGEQGVSILPELDWTYDGQGATFELHLATDASITNRVVDVSDVQNTAFQVQDSLTLDTTFYWRVRSHKGDTMSAWSPVRSFKTRGEIATVDLISPPNGSSGISLTPTFTWHPSDAAQEYELQLSTENDFSTLVTDTSSVTDTSHTFEGKLQGTTEYFWRVRAVRNGETSKWSTINSFITQPTVNVNYNEGWNLVGRPLEIENFHYLNLFPEATEGTLFGFTDSYQSRDSLFLGKGYWLRFGSSGSQSLSGASLQSIQRELSEGWNLIAGPSDTVYWNAIEDPDSILIENTLYGYDNSYNLTNRIVPGEGYWIRARNTGTITLQNARIKQEQYRPTVPEKFATLLVSDASENRQKLYFDGHLGEGLSSESFSLPPIPPENAFDVRFKGDRRLTETSEVHLLLQGFKPPLKLKVKNEHPSTRRYVAKAGETKKVWTGGETVRFSDGSIRQMTIHPLQEDNTVPRQYRLKDNYPNPFNPSTTIRYGLPKATEVQLSIYDIEGRRIAMPIDNRQEAGWHSIRFDASELASGVYFYILKAGDYRQMRKMILLK